MMDKRRPREDELRMAIHDLGSPLSAIRVLVEVLRLTEDGVGRKTELLDMMESQVEELAVGLERMSKLFTPSEPG